MCKYRDLIRHIISPELKRAKHYYIREQVQAFIAKGRGEDKVKVPVESIGIPRVTVVIVEDIHGNFARGVSMCHKELDVIKREKGVKRSAGRANAALMNQENSRPFNAHAAKILNSFHEDEFLFGSQFISADELTSFEKKLMSDKEAS
jgi:hypothetical protein